MNKFLSIILVAFLSSIVPVQIGMGYQPAGQPATSAMVRDLPAVSGPKLSAFLQSQISRLSSNQKVTATVILKSQIDLSSLSLQPSSQKEQKTVVALKQIAQQSQKDLRALLDNYRASGKVESVTPLWVFNGLVVKADPQVIQELAARPEVYRVDAEETFHAPPYLPVQPSLTPDTISPNAADWSVVALHAPEVWAKGFEGQGVTVAILDTGVDSTHPDLSSQYRGGSSSWFDPYNQHSTPTDMAGSSTGHGTAVMSVILGGSSSGEAIGIAPKAKWIAARIYDDTGSATSTAVHQAVQWLLDPDGNPATNDAPQVVSNSWSFASVVCDLSIQLDLQHLRSAGILPIFSAGNFGPNPSTGSSPGNYPEAFSVGAVDQQNTIASFSSRGPNSCGQAQGIFPNVVAPGVFVTVAAPQNTYTSDSGTSFSAPAVAGVLALLLSAKPGMTLAEQQHALVAGASDLGTPGLDNSYGGGMVDALTSLNIALTGQPGTPPTPVPTLNPPTGPAQSSFEMYMPLISR